MTPPQRVGRSCSARRSSLAPTFVSLYGFQALSLHQTPIGDLVRSVVATPCPRNSSVPSLVQSKSSWLFVQLAPGSREGQNSLEERSSAPHEWLEGRWVPNQGCGCRACSKKPSRDSRLLTTITDLRISSRPLQLALPWVPPGTRLQLDGWLTHLRSVSCYEPGSGPYQRLGPGSA